ncbi:MAG: SgcJ/EcaC family oxidoreductase, partial [Gemmataceae bacterium]
MLSELKMPYSKYSIPMRPALEALEARLTPADLAGVPTVGEVLELFNRWSEAVQSGDPDRVTALYAPNAILLPTIANDPRRTPEAIRDYFVEFLELKPVPRLDEYSIRASETLAGNSGLYTFAVTPAGQPFRVIAARFTFNYEKINGEWLIIQHHSSALPKPDPDVTTRFEIGALYESILG